MIKPKRNTEVALANPAPALKFIIYRDGDGQHRWRLKAGNNRTIAVAGEGYHNRGDCLVAIELVKESAGAPVKRGK